MRVLLFLLSTVLLVSCGLLRSEDSKPSIPGKIVFSAEGGGTYQIYTMNADGSNLKQLTHFPPNHAGVQPSWSSDGSKIIFSTTLKSTSNGFSLYIMNADDSNRHPMNDREGSPFPTPNGAPTVVK